MSQRRVLVTGATGAIAAQLMPALRERYRLTLVDVRPAPDDRPDLDGLEVRDLADRDRERYRALFAGVDAVVHLAYFNRRGQGPTAGDSEYENERVNLDMAHNVYQTALEEGVQRVVVASSNHAADWYERLIRAGALELVTPDLPPRAFNFYGWGKIAYESLGFLYACGDLGRKMGVVQVRIGAPREIVADRFLNNPEGYKRDLGAYISPRDMQQLFVKSIEAPSIDDEHGVPYQIFYGISGNARAFWSLANARRVIGYAPEDDSEIKYQKDIPRVLRADGAVPS